MLKKEFEELTGFHPSDDMYTAIEAEYMKMQDIDKTTFCQMYNNNTDGLASKIQFSCDVERKKKDDQAAANT